jgi:putative drug exporter of the RND superfamily
MRDFEKKGLFWYWGLKMYQFRWAVTIFWILLFIVSSLFAPKLPDRLKDSGFTPKGSESDHGITLMQKKLGTAPSILNIVYTSHYEDLTSQQSERKILQSLHSLTKLDYVKSIQINQIPRLHKDKGIQSVVIELSMKSSQALNHFPEIRRLITKPEGMNIYVDGNIATLYDTQLATKQDLAHAEVIGLPIALIILMFIFGTVWAALLPLTIGIMSVSLTLGLMYYLTGTYSLSNFLPNIVMMLGLAIGVDYALFLVSRFREELKRQLSIQEAVAMTIQTAGKSVFFSGFAVLIGMLGMLFIKLPIIYSLCLGGVVVVLSAVTLSCTLLPSLLGIFGHHINSLKVFPGIQRRMETSRLWERIAHGVMRRPAFLAIVICTLLLSLMLPITRMKLGVPTAEVLPPSYESRMGADILKNNYDKRKANPVLIILKTKRNFTDRMTIKSIQAYEDKIKKVPGVQEIRSYVDLLGSDGKAEQVKSNVIQERISAKKLAQGNFPLMTVVPQSDPESVAASKLVHQLRGVKASNLKPYITGQTALRVDILDRIYNGLPFMMLFIIMITYFVLFSAFKSVLIPIKAVLMNTLSLGASLGIVVIVFQYGWLADTLNITSIGYVSIIMPVTIFCVVFGISMDYEVFLISRIKEEYDISGDNDQSTAVGLQKTGSLISSAALIILVVVGSFIFTNIEITKALGVGLFCAILIDATLIRIIVVPALMKLLGPVNWWAPRWLTGR